MSGTTGNSTEGRQRSRSPSIEFISMERVAPKPFNDRTSDFVIQTRDNETKFFVSSQILAAASPYFYAIKQDPTCSSHLGVPESPATIEALLRFVYPVPDPILQDLDDVSDTYQAAVKYKITSASASLRRLLVSPQFLQAEPVRVYAIACRFGLEDEANLAAKRSLNHFSETWPEYEEFQHMSAQQYHTLLSLHRQRRAAAVRLLKSSGVHHGLVCAGCLRSPKPGSTKGPVWWYMYAKRAKEVLSETPSSDVVCSLEFVMQVATEVSDCELCWRSAMGAMKPGGAIMQLRALIDALNCDVAITASDS